MTDENNFLENKLHQNDCFYWKSSRMDRLASLKKKIHNDYLVDSERTLSKQQVRRNNSKKERREVSVRFKKIFP
ncbi:hypothetical protein AC623_17235 [Bacillus sp. FJAT-27231]|nr:hypothetical protein AC623_17235 [Bacillus sp. FJAT-27231]